MTAPVIYLHEADIDRMVARRTPVALALRAAGAAVTVPELPGHGIRAGDRPYDRRTQRLPTVVTVAHEVEAHLTATGVTDAVVLGGSLGGLCAIASAVLDARIRRAAVWLAPLFWCPSWSGIGSPEAARCDPARHLDKLYDRDLLLLLGATDPWAQPDRIIQTLPAASRFARAGGRLTVQVLPGHGHTQSPVLAEHIVSWLGRPAPGFDTTTARKDGRLE